MLKYFFRRFIGNLSVSRKLALIYALDLTTVIFISGILINEKFIAIDFAHKEILGTHYVAAVRDALMALPLARDARMSAAEQVRTAEIEYGTNLDSRKLSENFATLLSTPGNPSVQSTSEAAKTLIIRIGNQSNLILDPDLDSYYTMSLTVLRFPELFELIDLLQAKAAEKTSKGSPGNHQIQTDYLILEGRLNTIAQGINDDFSEAIAAYKPSQKAKMAQASDSLQEAIYAYSNSVKTYVFDTSDIISDAEYTTSAHYLVKELNKSWTIVNNNLEALLNARVSALFQRMWFHLSAAASLLLLILFTVYFVARQIAVPIRRLADVADQVRLSTNYELRAQWNSGDELGRLVSGFNDMLDQLNQSRFIEQEMAANARAAMAQRELLEAIPIPLVVTSIPKHDVLHSNEAAHQWLRGTTTDPWITGLEPAARVRFFQAMSDLGSVSEFEVRWQGADSLNWAVLSARRLLYQEQDALLTTFTPINSFKVMEQRLALWAKVFEASSENIVVMDAARSIVAVNRAFCRSSGYEAGEVLGKTAEFFESDRKDNLHLDEIWKIACARGSWQGEIYLRRKTGERFPLWAVVNTVRDHHGEVINLIVAALDITERKANEQRISHLAHHDTLTDLPNRSLCIERLRMALQQAERLKYRVGVLFIDLDRFKNINDSLGHHIGDGLLRSVSQGLLAAVRAGDTVSRLGGDEFVVILNGVVNLDEALHVVDHRLIPQIRQPHNVDGAELHISCSVGIAIYPEDGTDIDTLMRNADAAMYQAKSSGRNTAQIFTSELDSIVRERMKTENDLRYAVERNELCLYYQPRIDSRSGTLLGVEALVRWHHPDRGLVSPANFIPIAEETGLIVPMGAWIIGEACRQQAAWRDQGIGNIAISVNLSAVQLRDPEIVSTIQRPIDKYSLCPEYIEIELTESILMENVATNISTLQSIKNLGVVLSIDDFGTGYSSLNYLHRFPIDKLKIDQSFVCDMLEDPADLAITRAIIGLGHTLGLKVVAEGVENDDEARMLAAAGCDELQGYLFSRPVAPDDFIAWNANRYPVDQG